MAVASLRKFAPGDLALIRDFARMDATVLADDIGMELDPWQSKVLATNHKRILVNCHRQSGKSTIAGIKAVHKAIYKPRSLSLIFSPAMRQSGEVLQKCLTVYRDLGRPVLAEAENLYSLLLENGSRIISLPGSAATVRGYSNVDLIIVDEASLVKDELPIAISPMLAVSGGTFMALSTPHGKRGWWWDAWENGGDNWLRFRATADKCKRISKEFLAEEKKTLGPRAFSQEYMCEFVEVIDQAFREKDVQGAFARELEPLRFDLPEA